MVGKYPNGVFITLFVLLNCALFLPIYLFFGAQAAFWPGPATAESLFLQRANLDIFRLNFEFALLVCLWLLFRPLRRPLFWGLIFGLYLLQLSYAIYEGFIRSYYLLDPNFYNDLTLFGDGLRYVFTSLALSPGVYVGGLLLLTAVIVLCFALLRLLLGGIAPERLSQATRWGLVALTLAALGPLWLFKTGAGWPETAVSSFTAKLLQNAALSQTARAEAAHFDPERLADYYQFTQNELEQKPNVHLIFIESYGSILYKRPSLRQPYEHLLLLLDYRLKSSGWQVASTRSQAPTWGGGSWIAYTSAISGLQLQSHSQYLALLNQYQNAPLPHLVNYLRGQGYRSFRLSTNSDELNDVEWARYKRFYGVDEWLRFSDLDYSGPLYGWGPAPPDQYALHFASDYMRHSSAAPFVFFYITQNSHYPWTPLPPLARDWRSLIESPPPPVAIPAGLTEMRQRYLEAILYELEMLVDWIITQGGEDDIFVLIGDHQPARVAGYEDGWDTPLHIVSRDSAFITALTDLGLTPGLNTRTAVSDLHHAGFYSLFMRALQQEYGVDGAQLPHLLPHGFSAQ